MTSRATVRRERVVSRASAVVSCFTRIRHHSASRVRVVRSYKSASRARLARLARLASELVRALYRMHDSVTPREPVSRRISLVASDRFCCFFRPFLLFGPRRDTRGSSPHRRVRRDDDDDDGRAALRRRARRRVAPRSSGRRSSGRRSSGRRTSARRSSGRRSRELALDEASGGLALASRHTDRQRFNVYKDTESETRRFAKCGSRLPCLVDRYASERSRGERSLTHDDNTHATATTYQVGRAAAGGARGRDLHHRHGDRREAAAARGALRGARAARRTEGHGEDRLPLPLRDARRQGLS